MSVRSVVAKQVLSLSGYGVFTTPNNGEIVRSLAQRFISAMFYFLNMRTIFHDSSNPVWYYHSEYVYLLV